MPLVPLIWRHSPFIDDGSTRKNVSTLELYTPQSKRSTTQVYPLAFLAEPGSSGAMSKTAGTSRQAKDDGGLDSLKTQPIDDVAIVWLLFLRKKLDRSSMGKAIGPLSDGSMKPAKLAEAVLARLQRRGLVEADGAQPTEQGKSLALRLLGVDRIPAKATFRWAKPILLLRALNIPITAATLRALNESKGSGVLACALASSHGLNPRTVPSLSSVASTLAWRGLGLEPKGPFNATTAFAAILCAQKASPAAERTSKPAAMAVSGNHATPPLAKNGQATEPSDTGSGLVPFAERVMEAARSSPTGRWHDGQVFISHVWAQYQEQNDDGMRLEDFQRRLVEAHQARLLRLSRADLVEAMPRNDVNASEVGYLSTRFHFVDLETN